MDGKWMKWIKETVKFFFFLVYLLNVSENQEIANKELWLQNIN